MSPQFTSTLGFRRVRSPLVPFGDWPAAHDPTSADATPDYDSWGWDDWWTAADWQRWHGALKARFGLVEANHHFIAAWEQQSLGASPLDARSFNSDFKAYAKENGFYDALFQGLGVLARPVSAGVQVITAGSEVVEDVVDATASAVSTTAAAAKWLLPVAALVMGFLYLQTVTPRRRP
jgi:hypothetical protein